MKRKAPTTSGAFETGIAPLPQAGMRSSFTSWSLVAMSAAPTPGDWPVCGLSVVTVVVVVDVGVGVCVATGVGVVMAIFFLASALFPSAASELQAHKAIRLAIVPAPKAPLTMLFNIALPPPA